MHDAPRDLSVFLRRRRGTRDICREIRSGANFVAEELERRQLLSVTSAVISAPSGSSVQEGNVAVMTLTASTDNGNGTWWDINTDDGNPDQGMFVPGPGPDNPTQPVSAEFDYTFPGDEGASYDVTAKVYNDDNPCGTPPDDSPYDATPQTINITDAPITFNPSDPISMTEGDGTTTLTLGTISDPGTDPSPDPTYSGTIDWSNGATSDALFDGTTVYCACPFTDEGDFTGNVNVQDDGGQTASGTVAVHVADASIGVSVSGPSGAVEGQPLTNAVVGTVNDNNPNAPASDFSGTIDWGDGPNGPDGKSTSAASFQAVPGQRGVFNILGSHTYKEEGGYDMVITVNDKGGSSNGTGDSGYFNVADAAVNLSPVVQINGTEGINTGVLTVATLQDDNPNAPASDFANNVWISWGDGSSSAATLAPQEDGSFLVQGSHTYAEEGNYTGMVSAQDAGGSVAVPVFLGADIQDAPISLSPNSVGETELVPTGDILAAVLYDSNLSNTDATDFLGTATYGDNTAPVNVSFSSIGGGSFLVTAPDHTYPDEGTYTMQVNVQDIGGAPPVSCNTTVAVAEGAMGVSLASPIIQGSTDGKSNLTAMSLTTHVEPNAAWALVLFQADTAKVDVWAMPNPGPNDQPLLGLVNGAIVTSATWAAGAQPPSTLYVGAYYGSSQIGDVQFSLAEADSGTRADSVLSVGYTAVYFQIKSLAFGGDGEQSINEDNGTGTYDPNTQWLDGDLSGQIDGNANAGGTIDNGNEHQYPISYVRSTPDTPDTMEVTITVAGTLPVGLVVDGLTSYNNNTFFSPYTVVAGDVNNNVTTLHFTANSALPNTIDSADLTVTWQYSLSGSDYNFGEDTTNHLYVTGAAASDAYETELYIGCNAAIGLRPHDPNESEDDATTADRQVTDTIWGQFTGLAVKRVDGTTMQYNHEPGVTTFDAAGMLGQAQGKGQCTAWSDLLVTVLGYQGVSASVLDLASSQTFANSRFTVKAAPAQGSNGANYLVGTTHANYFTFHQIVAVNCYSGRLYDPSYGYMAEADGGEGAQAVWEDHSLVDVWNGAAWNPQTPGVEDLLMNPPNWFN